MSFAVSGVSGGTLHLQLAAFQALSVGGRAPVAPAASSAANPPAAFGNLSQAAQPTFNALLKLNTGSGPPVSFNVQAKPVVPVIVSGPSFPPSSRPQYVLPGNANLIARISALALRFASTAIYPAPIFSFTV